MSTDEPKPLSREVEMMKAMPRAQRRRIQKMLSKGIYFEDALQKEGFKLNFDNKE